MGVQLIFMKQPKSLKTYYRVRSRLNFLKKFNRQGSTEESLDLWLSVVGGPKDFVFQMMCRG